MVAVLLASTPAAQGQTNARGLDARNVDPTANPCTDFYQYADGGWLKHNPVPPAYGQWSLDDEITARNDAILRRIAESAAAHPGARGSATQKIGDFHAAAMDEAGIEKAGLAPLREDLDAIAALRTPADIAALIARWELRGDAVLFALDAEPDLKDSASDIAYAGQGGLGLPDRDYYLREDIASRQLRRAYRQYLARLLDLAGERDADAQAAWALALETTLARASLDRVALRDPANSYHPFALADAEAKTPHFSWGALFRDGGRADIQRFSLAQPDFFVAADALLAELPPAHWQAWLRARRLDESAPYLAKRFADAHFDFHGRTLHGAKQDKPRWKRALESADGAIGELLGEQYVAATFPPAARQRAQDLVANLVAALRARLERLTWMGAETKREALKKLDTLVVKIGYPDHWRDYSALGISRDSWLGNVRAAAAFEAQRQFAKFGRPVDRGEWDMTPQTVNAYYNPMRNEIVFPAAQLLSPYFDLDADDALNYGAIGSVIGHELTHGFDDVGSRFDAQGNLIAWWSASDRAEFARRTARLVRQFDAYVALDDLHIDGRATLGENIADLGGLLVAWDAFERTPQARAGARLDGLGPEQRFFLSYAQVWRTGYRPARLRLALRSDEHAPARFRVDGPLANMPAFAAAFGCKPGDALRRGADELVDIW